MQRGAVGAANLNQLLQAAINPAVVDQYGNATPELHRGGYTYRPGDKVMQIRNNYDKEVFNGDIGTIESIDINDRTLSVRYDERSVGYDVTELDEIVLAYATTVHKAQGAEYPIVVMPVLMTHYAMLQRNLLYTGVTRAKKGLVLVGQKKAISYCVRNVTVNERNTLLAERLSGAIDHVIESPRYVCFDVETPNSLNDRMSAIGISVVENGKVTQEFFSYVNPEEPFDAFNTQLTGISVATVASAPSFAQLWPEIEPILSSGILVAHNAPFDLSVLKNCLIAYGITWKERTRYLCTVRIGKTELPGVSHKLNDLCEHFGIQLDHHQADSDSRACAEILIRYMQSQAKLGNYLRWFALNK